MEKSTQQIAIKRVLEGKASKAELKTLIILAETEISEWVHFLELLHKKNKTYVPNTNKNWEEKETKFNYWWNGFKSGNPQVDECWNYFRHLLQQKAEEIEGEKKDFKIIDGYCNVCEQDCECCQCEGFNLGLEKVIEILKR